MCSIWNITPVYFDCRGKICKYLTCNVVYFKIIITINLYISYNIYYRYIFHIEFIMYTIAYDIETGIFNIINKKNGGTYSIQTSKVFNIFRY